MIFAFVGTYTQTEDFVQGKGEGIYVFRVEPASGKLVDSGHIAAVSNPSFLALHPHLPVLYAVSEATQAEGAVWSYKIDPSTGQLTALNTQPAGGVSPCHISLDQTGRWAVMSNYGSGSLSLFPVQGDGRLAPAATVIQHSGRGPNPLRQAEPHVHSAQFTPDNRFVLAADLGTDRLVVYKLDSENGTLLFHTAVNAPAGSGPRHFCFHSAGRFVYLVGELNATLTAFEFDVETGRLTPRQTVSLLPAGETGSHLAADIHLSPDGRFLYASNRGHDSLAIFAVDGNSGRLTPLDHQPTRGHTPRNFAIGPGGRYLLVANQDSDTIVPFAIDAHTGQLTFTGPVCHTPTPVCLKLWSLPG